LEHAQLADGAAADELSGRFEQRLAECFLQGSQRNGAKRYASV
jgi:hypothetical protein